MSTIFFAVGTPTSILAMWKQQLDAMDNNEYRSLFRSHITQNHCQQAAVVNGMFSGSLHYNFWTWPHPIDLLTKIMFLSTDGGIMCGKCTNNLVGLSVEKDQTTRAQAQQTQTETTRPVEVKREKIRTEKSPNEEVKKKKNNNNNNVTLIEELRNRQVQKKSQRAQEDTVEIPQITANIDDSESQLETQKSKIQNLIIASQEFATHTRTLVQAIEEQIKIPVVIPELKNLEEETNVSAAFHAHINAAEDKGRKEEKREIAKKLIAEKMSD